MSPGCAISASRFRCATAQGWRKRPGTRGSASSGGLSILGTTGIVVPYSCAAWIASIQRGVDVARAMGLQPRRRRDRRRQRDARARPGSGSPSEAYLDMGDFVGGLCKYLRRHPVERLTIAGGFAKMAKLAQGAMDLHSARGTVDLAQLDLACCAEDRRARGSARRAPPMSCLAHRRGGARPAGRGTGS